MNPPDDSDETISSPSTVQHRYEFPDDEAPSEAAVSAVAAVSDRPTAPYGEHDDARGDPLPPLFEAVNPEALDVMLGRTPEGATDPEVTFRYCGFSVRIRPGLVTVATLS